MAVWERVVATEFNFPNITVWKKLRDGVHVSWEVKPNDGYVMYDTTANDTELNPETMEEIPVVYYYTIMSCPLNYNFDAFTWVAVPRDSVDENYIFGVGDNDHEIM